MGPRSAHNEDRKSCLVCKDFLITNMAVTTSHNEK